MGLRDSFVNIAKNAAAGAASKFVSGVSNGLTAGLGGSTSSSASSPLQSGYNKQEPGILLYPSDVGTNIHHASYILFARHSVSGAKVKPAKIKIPKAPQQFKTVSSGDGSDFGAGGSLVKDDVATQKLQDEFNLAAKAKQGQGPGKGGAGKGGTSRSLVLQSMNIKKTGTFIGLYMPPAVNVSYAMDYSEGEVGVLTEAIAGLFKEYQANTLGFDSLKRGAKRVGTSVVKDQVLKGISKLGGGVGLEGAAEAYAMQTGSIITPRTEMFFKGIGRRSFSFTFTFIPKDANETQIVHKIVEQFKFGMTPEFKQAGSVREMTIPDVFSIQYMHINKENSYLNKIGKCYLKGMEVSYGGDKFVTYNADDGGAPPQKTTISLSFQEIEILDRANMKDGF